MRSATRPSRPADPPARSRSRPAWRQAVYHAELPEDVRDVRIAVPSLMTRRRRSPVGEALGDQREHLALAAREAQDAGWVVLAQPHFAGEAHHTLARDARNGLEQSERRGHRRARVPSRAGASRPISACQAAGRSRSRGRGTRHGPRGAGGGRREGRGASDAILARGRARHPEPGTLMAAPRPPPPAVARRALEVAARRRVWPSHPRNRARIPGCPVPSAIRISTAFSAPGAWNPSAPSAHAVFGSSGESRNPRSHSAIPSSKPPRAPPS